jgi:hypothetical protein
MVAATAEGRAMFWDDLIKVLFGPTIYRLDSLIGQKLAPCFTFWASPPS